MKVYITKEKEILEVEGRFNPEIPDAVFYQRTVYHFSECATGEGFDWHTTRQAAEKRISEM